MGDDGLRLLHDHHARQLDASAIAPEIVTARGYRTFVSAKEWRHFDDALGDAQLRLPGLGLPTYRLGQTQPHAFVLRPDKPRQTKDGKVIKYEWPNKIPLCLDVLPHYRHLLTDPSVPIWLVEGAKKADALASAYGDRIVPVNLNGVWAWRGKNLVGGKAVLPDFDEIAWNDRDIVLAFDSDVVRKRAVLTALQRLAAVLKAREAGRIRALALPHQGEGKTGVDDYLAAGHSTGELESHLVELDALVVAGREKLGTHPETGVDLYLPPGYVLAPVTNAISRLGRDGNPTPVYVGGLAVTATGVDLASSTETLTVRFASGESGGEVTAPRAELASRSGVIAHLASRGAVVHDQNARDVARYLVEFAHENALALPRRAHLDTYGVHGEGVLLGSGSVGFGEPVVYSGRLRISSGTDAEAYSAALCELATWKDAQTAWAVLALTWAAPMIARLRPRRNPAAYVAGDPGSGKTTLAQFALAAWGDPTRAPLMVVANDTSPVGLSQTIDLLGGLPLFVDECHMARFPDQIEQLAYRYANGEGRLIGSVDRQTRGGEPIGGSLILAGEAVPLFKNAGANRRVLWIDGTQHLPLGAGTIGRPGSDEHALGQKRAHVLERAWAVGSGVFGQQLTETIWANWKAFSDECYAIEQDPALAPLQAWKQPLAIALATLRVAQRLVPQIVQGQPTDATTLLSKWADMLTSGHEHNDPAVDAFEQLTLLLAQATISKDAYPGWEVALDARTKAMIACRYEHDKYWRVLTGTSEFEQKVGKSVVQRFGRGWVERGWVSAVNGKTSSSDCMPNRITARCLRVPLTALETWEPANDD